MAEPGDEIAAAGRDHGHFRASRADREQAIEMPKTAFAEDRLTKDESDRCSSGASSPSEPGGDLPR